MKAEKPSIEPLLVAAEEYYRDHDVSRALFCYKNALEWEIPDLSLWKGLARCYFILGDFDQSADFWKRASEFEPFDLDAQQHLSMYKSPSFQSWLKRISEAVKTVEMKEYERARDLLKDLLEEKDGVVSIYQILGLSHMACSDPVSARRVWEKGLKFDASNSMLLKYLQSLDEIQKPKGSEGKSLPKVRIKGSPWIKVGTGAAALLTCLAIFMASQQGVAKKTEISTEAQHTVAPSTGVQDNSLLINREEKVEPSRGSAAYAAGTAALDKRNDLLNPMNENEELRYYQNGFGAYLRGDWSGAKQSFFSVVDGASGTYINRESLYYLARIHYLSNQYNEAERYFQQYLTQFPESNYYDESLYYLACIYHRSGRDDLASLTFQELYRLMPDSGYLMTPDYQAVNLVKI